MSYAIRRRLIHYLANKTSETNVGKFTSTSSHNLATQRPHAQQLPLARHDKQPFYPEGKQEGSLVTSNVKLFANLNPNTIQQQQPRQKPREKGPVMASPSLGRKLADEFGLTTLSKSSKDVYLLLLTRFIRMFAYGSSTLILALYFATLSYSDAQIGLFMALTLVGDVAISLALTLVADTLGRRRIITCGALLMTFSGTVFALASNYWILLFAAVVGVISPSGNEIGPFRAVEESTIAHLSEAETRSDVFAWYVVVGTLGTAGGSLASGWGTQALQTAGWSEMSSFRLVFWVYAFIGLVKAAVSLLLSPACEAEAPKVREEEHEMDGTQGDEEQQAMLDDADNSDEDEPATTTTKPTAPQPPPPSTQNPKKNKLAISSLSPPTFRTLVKLCLLFTVDSLASGMVPSSLIALFLNRKFAMSTGKLGSIISTTAFISSIGNILASSIAKRIGLVKTMVFTHLPSAIFLALFPLPGTLWLAVALLVARSSLASMDQAPRTAFLAAVVRPEERTAVMGVVNTVKTMAQSAGPLFTGLLAGGGKFWIAFVVAGALKASYDMGMLSMFVNTKLEGEKREVVGGESNGSGSEPERGRTGR